jgi:hypothetical protein
VPILESFSSCSPWSASFLYHDRALVEHGWPVDQRAMKVQTSYAIETQAAGAGWIPQDSFVRTGILRSAGTDEASPSERRQAVSLPTTERKGPLQLYKQCWGEHPHQATQISMEPTAGRVNGSMRKPSPHCRGARRGMNRVRFWRQPKCAQENPQRSEALRMSPGRQPYTPHR